MCHATNEDSQRLSLGVTLQLDSSISAVISGAGTTDATLGVPSHASASISRTRQAQPAPSPRHRVTLSTSSPHLRALFGQGATFLQSKQRTRRPSRKSPRDSCKPAIPMAVIPRNLGFRATFCARSQSASADRHATSRTAQSGLSVGNGLQLGAAAESLAQTAGLDWERASPHPANRTGLDHQGDRQKRSSEQT